MGSILASIQGREFSSSYEDHYQRLEREFRTDCKWIWYVRAILTLMTLIWFFTVDGKELLFALYIPLDIMLNISVVVFFWYERYKAHKKEVVKQDRG